MEIGKVIQKYRKELNITQEEMANRLGVTAPAVNKWERGVTQPDIALLAPIARLLGVPLDTLLSFQKEPTTEEISKIIQTLDHMFEVSSYEEAFHYAADIIHNYPNCHMLIWQLAIILDARCVLNETIDATLYKPQIIRWYLRALESQNPEVKRHAADSLFHYYLNKENYEEAERYLCFFPEESTDRKRLLAEIYSKTDRRSNAYKTYEELLFSEYQTLSAVLHHLYLLSLEDQHIDQAKMWIDKASQLATLFDMGLYHSESCKLELATLEKNVSDTLSIVRHLLASFVQLCAFTDSPMYTHMEFKMVAESFYEKQRKNLVAALQDRQTFAYMKGNEEWEALVFETKL